MLIFYERSLVALSCSHPYRLKTYAGLSQNKLFIVRITHDKIVFLTMIKPNICLADKPSISWHKPLYGNRHICVRGSFPVFVA